MRVRFDQARHQRRAVAINDFSAFAREQFSAFGNCRDVIAFDAHFARKQIAACAVKDHRVGE